MELINNGLGESQTGGYDRIERWDEETTSKLTEHYAEILNLLGEDGRREGLKETPRRVPYTGLRDRSRRYPQIGCFSREVFRNGDRQGY